jgi:hypothetical protein
VDQITQIVGAAPDTVVVVPARQHPDTPVVGALQYPDLAEPSLSGAVASHVQHHLG